MVSWKLAQIPKFNLLIMACCKLVVYDRVPGNLGSWVFPKSYSTNLFGWVYISQGYAIVLRRGCQQLLVRVLPGNWIYPSQIAEGHLNGMNSLFKLTLSYFGWFKSQIRTFLPLTDARTSLNFGWHSINCTSYEALPSCYIFFSLTFPFWLIISFSFLKRIFLLSPKTIVSWSLVIPTDRIDRLKSLLIIKGFVTL